MSGGPMLPGPDCATATAGGACDIAFLRGALFLVACHLTSEDDPACRQELVCWDGKWERPSTQTCRSFPPCGEAGVGEYCRNEEGILCYQGPTLTCGDNSPDYTGSPTVFPILGSPCDEPGRQITDCKLNVGQGSACIEGVWVRMGHTCK